MGAGAWSASEYKLKAICGARHLLYDRVDEKLIAKHGRRKAFYTGGNSTCHQHIHMASVAAARLAELRLGFSQLWHGSVSLNEPNWYLSRGSARLKVQASLSCIYSNKSLYYCNARSNT